MKRSPTGRDPQDFESTDTLPMPVLEETGTFVLPAIAAIPVGVPDLAESLREHEQRLEVAAQRVAELEAGLAAANQRCSELLRERVALRLAAVPPEPGSALAAEESAELAAEVVALRQQNARLHEALSTVQGQLAVRDGMLDDAERALRQAKQAGRITARPDQEEWQVRCAELSTELDSERAASVERGQSQESRLSALEVELDAMRVRLLAPISAAENDESWRAAQPRPNAGVLRVLVREEAGTEVVYPLGRHTSIGRTPDNDIQVNATYVSRNHAVLLAGTEHCIVEDLNSTNGVLVNGHKVERQVLHDGDTLTIGKTHFRYQQRS